MLSLVVKGWTSCNRGRIKRRNSSSHVAGYGKEDIPLAYECHDHQNYNDSPLLPVLPSGGGDWIM